MSYYSRRRSYYSRWPSRSLSRWSRYSTRTTRGTKRRAIGNLIASNAQKDSATVNISIPHRCSAKYYKQTVNNVNIVTGTYACNIWDLLRKSDFYQSYSNMFDQVKIDSIKVKLTPVQWSFNTSNVGNVNYNNAITIVTAWDRSGLSADQLTVVKTPLVDGKLGSESDAGGIYVIIGNEIETYSSAITRNLNPGSSVNFSRVLYPSTMAEKTCYMNTNDLQPWYTGYDYSLGRFWGIPDEDATSLTNKTWRSDNPCTIREDPALPFKPTLLIAVKGGVPSMSYKDINAYDSDVPPVIFNAEFDIGVTFRGLRRAKTVAGKNVIIQDNKTVEITNYLDNIIVKPDTGYDALKQVTINTSIQPPAEHNIEQNKVVTINEFNPPWLITPSDNFDYMQQVTLNVKFRVTNIDIGYSYIPEESFDGNPIIVHDKHYFTDTIFKKKHAYVTETVSQYHIRLGMRIAKMDPNIRMTEIFLIFAAQGPVSYLSDYDYRYLDIPTDHTKWAYWRSFPWKFEGDNNTRIESFSPFYFKKRIGPVIGVKNTLFKFYYDLDKYNFPIWETEDEDNLNIFDISNQDPDLSVYISEDE